MRKPTPGLGARVKQAREAAGLTLQEFQSGVAELTEDAKGSSYGSIWSYENDPPPEPRPNIVFAMAEVLRHRYEWIMWEEGPPTDAHRPTEEALAESEAIMPTIDGPTMGRRWRDYDFQEVLEDAFGDRVPALARAAVAHHWRRVHVAASTSPATNGDSGEDVLRSLGGALMAPLVALGIQWTDMLEDTKTDYVLGVLPAIAREWERHLRRAEVEAMASGSQIIQNEPQDQEDTDG